MIRQTVLNLFKHIFCEEIFRSHREPGKRNAPAAYQIPQISIKLRNPYSKNKNKNDRIYNL